jgi:hypothetical protein
MQKVYMVINQKLKGKRIELDIVHWLKSHGVESAQRTQQYSGTEGTSDIICPNELPEWHIECKGTKSGLLIRSQLLKWYEQVGRDCPVDKQAVILNKSNGKELIALMPFSTWLEVTKERSPFQIDLILTDSVNAAEDLNFKYRYFNAACWFNQGANFPPAALYFILDEKAPFQTLVIIRAEYWLWLARPMERHLGDACNN